jgi:tetratricopeptide (TPR) repeat protein
MQKPSLSAPFLAQASRLRQAGRLIESIAPLRQAAALDPVNTDILHDLGLTLLQTGQTREAVQALRSAIARRESFAHAHWRLGNALESLGDSEGAISSYRSALSHDPSLYGAEFRLGGLLETAGHRKHAAECYRRASARQPKPANYVTKSRALILERQTEDAERLLRRAIAHDRTHAPAYAQLGDLLSESGAFDEAASCYRSALQHAPDMAQLYYGLVRCRRLTRADAALVDAMRASLAQPSLQRLQIVQLQLALGKALDDLGDYRSAMAAFDAADSVRRQLAPFDRSAFDADLNWAMATFTGTAMATPADMPDGDVPVLIVGMPRSGTTLCEQILSAHPDIFGAGELPFWNSQGPTLRPDSPAEKLADLGRRYVALIRQLTPDARRITDKMPSNFLWLGAVHAALPHARIIHCRRNPIDTALSIHQTFFNTALKFPTGGADLVSYYRGYETIMAHWRKVLPSDRFLEIDYEDLAATPEPVIRNMIDFIGLPWNAACLSPERNQRAVNTPSRWQVRQPINRNSIGRAERYYPFLGELSALRA